jgi:uncharacterized protein
VDHDRAGADLTTVWLQDLVEPSGTGCRLLVRLTPKSSRDAIQGVETLADGRVFLKARVRAVPEKGAANAALVRLLSKALRLPASAVGISAGATSRLKTVQIELDVAEVVAALADISS